MMLLKLLPLLLLSTLVNAGDFHPATTLGIVRNPELIELSGVVTGGINPDVLWVHNDQNNLPRLYALNLKGETVATYILDAFNEEGTMAGDWEDIARLPHPKGHHDLYIADFGNNAMVKKEHRLLIIEEPGINSAKSSEVGEIEFRAIYFQYPRDYVCNSECLLVHPVSGEVFIVSKSVKEGGKQRPNSAVWSLPDLTKEDSIYTATLVAESIPAITDRVTGGDISPDGKHLIIRTNTPKAYLWEWKDGESLKEVLKSSPKEIPLADEKGGEAICFSEGGSKLFSVYDGKKKNRPLHIYHKK